MSTASNMTNNEASQACLATRQSLITPTNFRFDYFPYGEGKPSVDSNFLRHLFTHCLCPHQFACRK